MLEVYFPAKNCRSDDLLATYSTRTIFDPISALASKALKNLREGCLTDMGFLCSTP